MLEYWKHKRLIKKLSRIKAVAMDVDGVLTDCRIWMSSDSRWVRAFTVRDGIGIKNLIQSGYKVGWISGSDSDDILMRAKMLGVDFVSMGQENKTSSFQTFLQKTGCTADEVAYIGDDLPDLPLLQTAGLAVTVPEAVCQLRRTADFITRSNGGAGAVRELCDKVLMDGRYSKNGMKRHERIGN